MRQATIITLLAAFVLVGCAKKPPPDVEIVAPPRSADELTPAGPEVTELPTPPLQEPPTPDRPEPAPTPPPPAINTHVVQHGETLWSLAVKYYSDGQQWTRIAQANNITDPAKLRVGQVLKIPQ